MKGSVAIVAAGLVAAIVAAAVAGQERSAVVAAGERAFKAQGCYGCHLVGKFGTPIGPDLSRVGLKYSEGWIARWLRDPEAQRPSAHMPKLELTAEEIEALAAFLSSQR
jgi:cytochrome c oxidase subunit 2